MNFTVSSHKHPKLLSFSRAIGKRALLLTVGGIAYYSLEVMWRGHSHWTMALCGGVCLAAIYRMNCFLCRRNIAIRAALGCAIITAVEFACGYIVNLILRWNIWDYSSIPLNLLGQICLPFSLIWFLLSFPVCLLCNFAKNMFGD